MAVPPKIDWTPDNLKIELGSDVPEFFVDGYEGVLQSGGVVRINFIQYRIGNYEDFATEKQVNLRLMMPFSVLVGVTDALNKVIEQMKAEGLVSPAEPTAEGEPASPAVKK